jgi:DNA repair photolyase
MKNFKGKAIYNPSGKAGEYSYWACNFYVGCSNGCTYCYLKKGRGAEILGGCTPTLKKCFKSQEHALEIAMNEIARNEDEIRKHGLFFSFTTDPMLFETKTLTMDLVEACNGIGIPVKILTKRADFFEFLEMYEKAAVDWDKSLIAFGFTLTGHDELETKASKNKDRIHAMRKLKRFGYKTFASIEPIIDFASARSVIQATLNCCDLYKVGLESGKKYDVVEAQTFVEWLWELEDNRFYLKESLQRLTHYTNAEEKHFVERDYNLFNHGK